MRQWRVFSAIILGSLLLFACQKSGKQAAPASAGREQPPASPQKQPDPSSATPSPGNAGTRAGDTGSPAPTAAQPGPDAVQKETAASDRDLKSVPARSMASAASLMALGHTARLLPEDFKIGPLGDARSTRQEENRAIATAAAFLRSIVAGSVDTRLLTPDSQDAVTDSLSHGLKQGYTPTFFRLGAPKSQENGQITATVRLFGAVGTSEGEIYLAKAGTEWLVADLQLSLAQLSTKREPPEEKFFPSSYRWLLEGSD